MTEEREQMLISTFIINRVLIGQILLFPEKYIALKVDKAQVKGLKLMASALHHLSMAVVVDLFGRLLDREVFTAVYRKTDLDSVLTVEWVDRMKLLYHALLDKFIALISRVQETVKESNLRVLH